MGRLRTELAKRRARLGNEEGASILLPIVVVGLLIIMGAAMIASSTSMAAKVSGKQVRGLTADLDRQSIANKFMANIYSGTAIAPSGTVANVGSYQVYYSLNAQEPQSLSSVGVTKLTAALPALSEWILIETTPLKGPKGLAIYRYQAKGTSSLDNAIDWKGTSVAITNSKIAAAQGVESPTQLVFEGNGSLNIKNSEIEGNISSNLTSASRLEKSVVSGNVYLKSGLTLATNPEVRGDLTSGGVISGVGIVRGTKLQNSSVAAPLATNGANAHNTSSTVTLTSANCATPAALKQKLESITVDSYVKGSCAAASFGTVFEPKANLTIEYSSGALSNMEVKGTKGGSMNIYRNGNLTLSNVKYTEGATAVTSVRSGSLTVQGSKLRGSIVSLGSATGANLSMVDSELLFVPQKTTMTKLCGTAACAIASSSGHLTQIR